MAKRRRGPRKSGAEVAFELNEKAIEAAVTKGNFESLRHAVASIRKDAAASVQKARAGIPSRPGDPPYTHRGAFYRRAIRWDVDKEQGEAIVGFRHSVIGDVGAVHEFGESREGTDYPERPTLWPALQRAAPRLTNFWADSIGG